MRIAGWGAARGASLPVCLLAIGLLGGCPGSLTNEEAFLGGGGKEDSGDDGPGGSNCDVEGIFANETTGCAGASCHSAGQTAPDLVTPGVWERLVAADGLICAGSKLVTPGDADNSTLFKKVASDTPGCGSRMPAGGRAALSATDIECVRQWILDNSN